jgi:glycosyltransferase involved in cell wall biosynthesis
MKKICIVTTRHISYNPRVLKEADTFQKEGYEVTVVTINNHPDQAGFDEQLMRQRTWRLRTVDFQKKDSREKRRWFYLSLKQKLFLTLAKMGFRSGVAERAVCKAFDQLLELAKKEKADLYLAHHAEALGVGFKAARYNGAFFGFDAEDFHSGMTEAADPSFMDRLISWLEAKYLPYCRYMTAASKGIALAYKDKYGVPEPQVILNVFPFEALPVTPVGNPVRFYWYSQVIGPNRGIGLLLNAAGKAASEKLAFEIHLRGSLNDARYEAHLWALADRNRIRDKVFLHGPILAGEIISDANRFDVGMALESDISTNRNICVTNKVFSYLMSGLFIIGTATFGQKDIFSHMPGAVRMCRVNDADDLAEAMRYVLLHPDRLAQGKTAARDAAANGFNWESESRLLLNYLKGILQS